MVNGFVRHVDAGFAAKSKSKGLRVDIFLLAFSVNVNVIFVFTSTFSSIPGYLCEFVCVQLHIAPYIDQHHNVYVVIFVKTCVDHVGCLRNRAVDKSRRHLPNWFCGNECEQVY